MKLYSFPVPDPFTAMALGAYLVTTSGAGVSRRWTDTAASVTWSARASVPTGCFPFTDLVEYQSEIQRSPVDFLPSLGWVDLARVVLAESRSLNGWERESLDEFTWAELRA